MQPLIELALRKMGIVTSLSSPPALFRTMDVERLEDRFVPSTVTQTMVISDNSGHALQGVQVAVTDFSSSKAPKLTDASGKVSFTVDSGIRSVLATKNGYADKFQTIYTSASSFSLRLDSLTSTLSTSYSSANGQDVKKLYSQEGGLTYVGNFSMDRFLTGNIAVPGFVAGACGFLAVAQPETAPGTVPCAGAAAAYTGLAAIEKSIWTAMENMGAVSTATLSLYWNSSTHTFVVFTSR